MNYPDPFFWIAWIIGAFLIGSIPFGVILARAHGVDIRTVGSGNTGATNVGRALGRKWGFVCFLLDASKGAVPVLISGAIAGTLGAWPSELTPGAAWGWLAIGFAAMLGHIFSPILRLRGGKGVATAFGAFIVMWPLMSIPAIAASLVFLLAHKVTRYMSLASIVAAWSIPITALVMVFLDEGAQVAAVGPPLVAGIAIGGLVTIRHRGNIARILAGTEPKTGARDTMPRSQEPHEEEPSKTPTTSSDHR